MCVALALTLHRLQGSEEGNLPSVALRDVSTLFDLLGEIVSCPLVPACGALHAVGALVRCANPIWSSAQIVACPGVLLCGPLYALGAVAKKGFQDYRNVC